MAHLHSGSSGVHEHSRTSGVHRVDLDSSEVDLDSLLVDLESTIENRSQQVPLSTIERRREVVGLKAPRGASGCGSEESVTKMTTAALSSNLNELDILLQDLSAARYSGHIERTETVSESRSYSSHTNGFTDHSSAPIVPPKPPERSKSRNSLGKYSVVDKYTPVEKYTPTSTNGNHGINGDTDLVENHVQETRISRTSTEGVTRTSTEESRNIHTENGSNLESKWEYMGFGIWENKDGDEPAPPPAVRYFNEQNDVRSVAQVDSTNASSATQELDELMTSLNNFKMADRTVDEPVISGPPTLDDMLGNLQEDMHKQGIKTTQKGVCAACNKPIVGQVITALGRTWHPEHFNCSHCNQELGTRNFFERDGKPYCEQDYHHLFSPRCGYCQGPILDKCISALDQTWHPEHFLCADCGKQFGDDGFHEKDDSAYCKDCYFEQFAPKCGGCSNPIRENYISSLNMQWHPNCFVCKECSQPFNDGAFFEHEGFPYCETHYHALRGSLCAGCHKAISGRCITAMFRKFHPEHFVCSFCLKQLNKGTFKEQGDKPYCHDCFDRLFG